MRMLGDLVNCLFKEAEKIEINEFDQRKIKIIGDFVREYTKDNLENLIKLSNVIYASNHLSLVEETEKIIKLIRKINENIQKKSHR